MAILRRRKDMTAPVLLRHSYIIDFDWTHDEWYNGSSLRCSNGIPVTFLTSTAGRSRKTYMNLLLLCLPREAILQNPLDQPINWFHPIPHSVFNIFNHDLLLINKKDILMFCELHFFIDKAWFEQVPFSDIVPHVPEKILWFLCLFAGAWYVVPSWCRSQQTKSSVIPCWPTASTTPETWR